MKRLAIALFSIGWLVPAWIGLDTFMTFLNAEAWPLLRGAQPANSFPFVAFSARCWTVAFVWFAGVAAFWSWRLSPLIERGQDRVQPPKSTSER